jgi:carbonic anhydrase/acetyltransferase-like protein (isoleucine patch superfamily)
VTTSAVESGGPILRPFGGIWPRIAASTWLAPGAVVVGDVVVGADSSIWYGSVVRGDVHHVRIGARTNLQDQCVAHVTQGRFACEIGDAVVGAGAVVTPGSKVEPGMLAVGMPARVVRALTEEEQLLQRRRTLSYVETARAHAEAVPGC